jgi:protein-S-isoprenylcysteine O-methyltransferase Ste14
MTPWAYRQRALVIALIYAGAFFFGYLIQGYAFGDVRPTFVLIGEWIGPGGVAVMAFVAALLVAVTYCIRLWASSYHAPGVVMMHDVVTDRLTIAGPYRFVRNPLYLGNITLALGMGLLAPPIGAALVVIGNLVFVNWLCTVEERFMARTHGEIYRQYCAEVPRLIPHIWPIGRSAGAPRASFAIGFRTEIVFLGLTLAMFYFAVVAILFGRQSYFGWVMCGIVAAFLVWQQVANRPSKGRGR